MKLSFPEKLTLDSLEDIGIREYDILPVMGENIEFHSRDVISIDDAVYTIDPEGLKELGSFIGISKQYLNKLPDDLFAYTMNYFYRRSEGAIFELLVDTEAESIMGIQMEGTKRLSLKEILDSIYKTVEGIPDFVEFERINGNYKITIVKEKLEETDYFCTMTININDRLWIDPSVSLGLYIWGPTISLGNYLTAELPKGSTWEKAELQFEEILEFSYNAMDEVVKHSVENAEQSMLDNPLHTMQKIFHDNGLAKYSEKLLSNTTIDEEQDSCYSVAKKIANLSQNERITKNQSKRLESIANYVLTGLTKDHRCSLCLAVIND